jgi:hypothetical protein
VGIGIGSTGGVGVGGGCGVGVKTVAPTRRTAGVASDTKFAVGKLPGGGAAAWPASALDVAPHPAKKRSRTGARQAAFLIEKVTITKRVLPVFPRMKHRGKELIKYNTVCFERKMTVFYLQLTSKTSYAILP